MNISKYIVTFFAWTAKYSRMEWGKKWIENQKIGYVLPLVPNIITAEIKTTYVQC